MFDFLAGSGTGDLITPSRDEGRVFSKVNKGERKIYTNSLFQSQDFFALKFPLLLILIIHKKKQSNKILTSNKLI